MPKIIILYKGYRNRVNAPHACFFLAIHGEIFTIRAERKDRFSLTAIDADVIGSKTKIFL